MDQNHSQKGETRYNEKKIQFERYNEKKNTNQNLEQWASKLQTNNIIA